MARTACPGLSAPSVPLRLASLLRRRPPSLPTGHTVCAALASRPVFLEGRRSSQPHCPRGHPWAPRSHAAGGQQGRLSSYSPFY